MRQWAEKAASIIATLYGPDKIILFGSCAKGAETLHSDIDLLIVKDTDVPRAHRGTEVSSAVARFPVKFDLLFYTNRELADASIAEHSFIRSILQTGVLLYESP